MGDEEREWEEREKKRGREKQGDNRQIDRQIERQIGRQTDKARVNEWWNKHWFWVSILEHFRLIFES